MMTPNNEPATVWSLYLIRSGDGSLYTGISTDVRRRIAEHENQGKKNKGAKALRGKMSLSLVFTIVVGSRSNASKLEYKVKQLSRTQKEQLIGQCPDVEELISWLQGE